jgi:uncharacterized protein YgiM (DUF1202 family)
MMGRMSRVFALLVAPLGVALWLVWSGEATAAARVALVVGNGDYAAEIGKLKNPTSDAQMVADTLTGLGFEVALVTDADQKGMKRAIREFGQKLRATGPQGIGLFYYAGHGVQVDGENFLLPVGAEIQAEGDVELEAVSASSILSQMQFAGNAVNLVFLDACRNNPLTRSFRSGSRGLARVDAPRGSFVGYSTAPGDVSVDGENNNSPYALALVEELNTPGISIEEAHRAVRGKVLAATNQRQTPWDSSSLTGPVVLKQVTMVAPIAPAAPIATAPSEPSGGASTQQAELLFWDSIKHSDNPATFEAYLTQFPNGVFAGLARAKIAELESGDPAETQSAARQIQPAEPESQSAPQADEPAPLAVEALSGVYVATKSANVRAAPATDAKIVAKLAVDQAVDATGQVAGGEWLRVSVKGKTGFVSGKLMAESDATEVAAWTALKSAPSEAGAQSFIADHPSGHFRPKAEALLAKLQAPKVEKKKVEVTQTTEATPAPQPVAPAQTQQAAATPAPSVTIVRIASGFQNDIERFISNSRKFTGKHRFLAVNNDGSRIGIGQCDRTGYWDGCGGFNDTRLGAKKSALSQCGGGCRILYEGADKVGVFEIEYY